MLTIRPDSGFPDWLEERASGTLADHLDFEFVSLRGQVAVLEVGIRTYHMAPNGRLHGGAVTAIADTLTGVACRALLPPAASGFATLELKTNFVGTASVGERLQAVARLAHGGRTTQVWDCELGVPARGTTIAMFRCTQIVFYRD